MKLEDSNGNSIVVKWHGHAAECDHCAKVNTQASVTFVHACPLGARLLNEELAIRQRPIQKQKDKEIEDWAKRAGVFKIGRNKADFTKYVGDDEPDNQAS